MIEHALWIAMTAAGFGLLILVHEFGHFIAAKLMKVDVEAFSIGFGPHVGRTWHGTEYRLSAVPLGGYVKLSGELREEGREPGPNEFYGRPVWQRIVVFLAGIFMNSVLAVALFAAAFTIGVPKAPPVLGYVAPGGPAWVAGLREGDRVVGVNGKTGLLEFADVSVAALFADPGKPISITVERDGKRLPPFRVTPEYEEESGFQRIRVAAKNTLDVGELYYVTADGQLAKPVKSPATATAEQRAGSPALAAGLLPGDRVISANGTPIASPHQLTEDIVHVSAGKPVRLAYERDGATHEATLTPKPLGRYLIGIVCRSTLVEAVRQDSWAQRAGLAVGDTIVAVNGRPTSALSQLKDAAAQGPEGAVLTVRSPEDESRTVLVARADIAAIDHSVYFEQTNILNELTPGFPAEAAGLKPGDVLVAVTRYEKDGAVTSVTIAEQKDLTEPVTNSDGRPLRLTYRRGDETLETELTPAREYLVGMLFKPLEEPIKMGLGAAAVFGSRKALEWLPRFYHTIRGFILRSVSARHLGGPVGIVKYTYRAAQHGPGVLLYFLGIISMNLALFNLLPIPVLDGGHVFFALIEKAKGSPVSEKVQIRAAYVGLALLVALMLYATFNDFFPKLR